MQFWFLCFILFWHIDADKEAARKTQPCYCEATLARDPGWDKSSIALFSELDTSYIECPSFQGRQFHLENQDFEDRENNVDFEDVLGYGYLQFGMEMCSLQAHEQEAGTVLQSVRRLLGAMSRLEFLAAATPTYRQFIDTEFAEKKQQPQKERENQGKRKGCINQRRGSDWKRWKQTIAFSAVLHAAYHHSLASDGFLTISGGKCTSFFHTGYCSSNEFFDIAHTRPCGCPSQGLSGPFYDAPSGEGHP